MDLLNGVECPDCKGDGTLAADWDECPRCYGTGKFYGDDWHAHMRVARAEKELRRCEQVLSLARRRTVAAAAELAAARRNLPDEKARSCESRHLADADFVAEAAGSPVQRDSLAVQRGGGADGGLGTQEGAFAP